MTDTSKQDEQWDRLLQKIEKDGLPTQIYVSKDMVKFWLQDLSSGGRVDLVSLYQAVYAGTIPVTVINNLPKDKSTVIFSWLKSPSLGTDLVAEEGRKSKLST